MSNFYSATGELIKKDSAQAPKVVLQESIEYKANGNLVIEKDEKEKVVKSKKAFDPPENPLFRFNHLKKRTPYFEDE